MGLAIMDTQITVLSLLKKARDLVGSGQYSGIIEAIAALKGEASGPKRDLAYYELLETASARPGDANLATLAASDSRDASIALIDATIKRMTSKLH